MAVQSGAIDLLDHAHSVFSQNGEDGVVAALFSVIGTTSRNCCEFGAGDGVHLSNTRALLLGGWRGLLIEADEDRYRRLVETYAGRADVTCVRAYVDTDENSVGALVRRHAGDDEPLDFLSIDIDGFDYEIFCSLGVHPRVICVEVGAALNPAASRLLPPEIASTGVGQPLPCFCSAADQMGYRLIAYNGLNAFFLREDVGYEAEFPTLTPIEAYERFLLRCPPTGRQLLYYQNRGLVFPYHRYQNPWLSRAALNLPRRQVLLGACEIVVRQAGARLLRATHTDSLVRALFRRSGVRLRHYDAAPLVDRSGPSVPTATRHG
jgi:hypothetical protein